MFSLKILNLKNNFNFNQFQGHFCPVGTVTPQPCPSGYYSNVTNVPRSVECFPCPAGKYCAGTGNLQPTEDCDAGFYCKQAAYTSVRNTLLYFFNLLTARIFTVYRKQLIDRVLHKKTWIVTLLGTHFLKIKDHKKAKFPGRDILFFGS